MKTILFICPYFGKLPIAHMKLWLLSCEKNPTINWLILTDDYTEELKYPSNVKVVYTTLEAIKQQVQKMFDFPIYGHMAKIQELVRTSKELVSQKLTQISKNTIRHVTVSPIVITFGVFREYITIGRFIVT